MKKEFAWEFFKNTGNIEAFMEFKGVNNFPEEGFEAKEHGNDKDYRSNNIGKSHGGF